MVDFEAPEGSQTMESVSQPSIEALKQAAQSTSDDRISSQPADLAPSGSLAAEESAGGPPMPSAAPPSVAAIRQGDAEEVKHQVDGQILANGHGEHLGGGSGMPGHARELGNGPEVDASAPPMSVDVDQPMAPAARLDGDVAMDTATAPHINTEVASVVDAAKPLLSSHHLAPATEPGSGVPETHLSAASNATAPPSPGGEAEQVAASSEQPSVDAVMADATSPSIAKRPAEDDEVEREAKRQRYETGSSMDAPGSELAASTDVKPVMGDDSMAFSADSSLDHSHLSHDYAPDSYASFDQHPSYSASTAHAAIDSSMPTDGQAPEASTSALPKLETGDAIVPSQPMSSSAAGSPSSYTPYSPSAPMGTIDPGALSNPPSASMDMMPAPALPPMPTKLAKEHYKFAEGIIRKLKQQRESLPFLVPVDPVALNIPQYFNFIKDPMDLSTIEKKLKAHSYRTIDEWIADVRLIWANCYTFNGQPGPTAPVSISAKVMEDVFEKHVQKIPAIKPPAPPKPKALPGYRAGPSSHQNQLRRASGGRQVRAPQQWEPDYDEAPPRPPKQRMTGAAGSQMRYAREILRDVLKKSNESWTIPFRYPVDPMQYPDYPRIIKKPMDLSTVQRKFDMGDYASIEHFAADMRLICKNCFAYNPVGTPVHEMGRKLEHLVESKMLQMPDFDEEEEDMYGYGADADPSIANMERQLAEMQRNLAAMKQAKKAAAPPKPKPPPRPRPSPEHQRRPSVPAKPDYLSDEYDDTEGSEMVQTPGGPRAVTFDMKRELATKIENLEGNQLEEAIEIIRNSVPHLLGDESKEIELDIDQLDGTTLYKLYEYVTAVQGGPKSPVRRKPEATLTAAGHRAQKSGRAGTGGLKGTHLDETIESAKIAALQEKLDALENNAVDSPSTTTAPQLGASTNNAAAEDGTSSEDNYSSDSDQD